MRNFFRNKHRYMIVVLLSVISYLIYLFRWWSLTPSRVLNLIGSVHILLLLLLVLYYLYYRYVDTKMSAASHHRWFYIILSAFLISFSLAIWGIPENDGIRILLKRVFAIPVILSYLKVGSVTAPPMRVLLLFYSGGIILTGILVSLDRLTGSLRRPLVVKSLFSFALFCLLVSSLTYFFSSNMLQTDPGSEYRLFMGGNETYIKDRLRNDTTFLEDLELFGGFNYRFLEDELQIYFSRTGFYGSVLKLLMDVTGMEPHHFIKSAHVVVSLLMAVVIGLLAGFVRRWKGVIAAAVFIIPIPVTYWISGPAKELLWFYFLFFLPFLYSLIFYPRVLKQELALRKFSAHLFLVYIFAFLHGYEFLSNQILSAAVPVFFYEFSTKSPFRRLFLRCFVVCLVGLAAFGFVFGIHFAQLSGYLESNSAAWAYFTDRTVTRITGGEKTYYDMVVSWMKVPVFYFSEIHFMHSNGRSLLDHNLPVLHPWNSFGTFHSAFLAMAVAAVSLRVLAVRGFLKNFHVIKDIRDSYNLAVTGFIAMVGSWSWALAKNAMLRHYHQNGMMFMIPFALVVYMLLAFLFQIILDGYFQADE